MRSEDEALDPIHIDLAASAQKLIEDIILEFA